MKSKLSKVMSLGLAALLAMPAGITRAEDDDDELVTFIVQTAAGTPTAVLKAELESSGMMSAAAVKAEVERSDEMLAEKNRDILEATAKETGANASDSYIYTQLDSAFSITAHRSDREKILSVYGVIDIDEAVDMEVIPDDEMSGSAENVTAELDERYKGQGTLIAVIDSGFNIRHDYFAAAPSEVKYTKEQIETLINEGDGTGTAIGRGAYYSEKIPFMYDYYEKNSNAASIGNYGEHGTHVAGIAAGKNGIAPDGSVLNGTAPDAQLALMACGTSATGISGEAYLAALNDAAALGADVINMSFGIDYVDIRSGYDSQLTAAKNAHQAGITLCASSGNSGRGFLDSTPLVTNIDYGSGGSWQKITDTMSVASAEAAEYFKALTGLSLSNSMVLYGDDYAVNNKYFYQTIAADTGVVSCGIGAAADFAGKDLNGKIALIQRGSISFADKTTNAKNAGAIAAIVYDNVEESYITAAGFTLPTLFMLKSDGVQLAEALNNDPSLTVSVTGNADHKVENGTNAGKPSSFSSWGVSERLELVPNIMGFGGNVYSADWTGTSKYMTLNGTSMAAPYVAGICASVKSYLNTEPFGALEGVNTDDLIRQMAASSAVPSRDGLGILYSPRQQGAGLANVKAALNSPVMLFNSDNKTVINLGDGLSNELVLSFTAHNYSGDDVVFNEVSVETVTDDYTVSGGQNYVDGMKALTVKAYDSDPVTVGAYSDEDITINVTLDANELADNARVFTNGFYIDGFVTLSGSALTVSIPFMGFYGNWGAAPIWDKTMYDEGGSSLYDSQNKIYGTYLATAVSGQNTVLGTDPNASAYNKDYMIISPANGDKKYDTLVTYFTMFRASHGVKLELVGDKTYSTSMGSYYSKFKTYNKSFPNLSKAADGEYTMKLTGWFDDDKKKTQQSMTFPYKIIVDNTAPAVVQTLSGDEALLSVSAEDEHFVRSISVSYTDQNGAAQSETKNFDSTNTSEAASFELKNAKISTIVVTAEDYAYNKTEQAYTGFSANASAAYAEAAAENIEGDTDVTGFITEIKGCGTVSGIRWTVTSNGVTKEFAAAAEEIANLTLEGGSANVFFLLRGLNDSNAQAEVSVE